MRRWLAKWLYPEAFKDAKRYAYLRRRLDELQRWCGHEAPEIDHAIVWAKKSLRIYSMSLEEYDALVQSREWPKAAVGGIDQFREELRRRAKSQAEAA